MKLALAALLALAVAAPKKCNPKKNTSCCRAPRRPPPAAIGEIYPADMPTPSGRRQKVQVREAGVREALEVGEAEQVREAGLPGQVPQVVRRLLGTEDRHRVLHAEGHDGVAGLEGGAVGEDGRRAPEEAARRVGRLDDGHPVRLHYVQGRRDGGWAVQNS